MQRLRTLHLFAGAGGGILADLLLGHVPVCAVESDLHCARVLSARQSDGILPWFPIFEDVKTFDGRPWRGLVDVVAGGFPCQDLSWAGAGAGLSGSKSGLWYEMARVVSEVLPRYVFVENVPPLLRRGFPEVLGALSSLGYDARWGVLGADDVGAPHKRKRVWVIAHAHHGEEHALPLHAQVGSASSSSYPHSDGRAGQRASVPASSSVSSSQCASWWQSEPPVGRVADGVAHRVVRLRALGNGQVPSVAAAAWRLIGKI